MKRLIVYRQTAQLLIICGFQIVVPVYGMRYLSPVSFTIVRQILVVQLVSRVHRELAQISRPFQV